MVDSLFTTVLILLWPTRGRDSVMKITYLDQNHWINLSKAAWGRHNDPGMARVLDALDQARATGHVYLLTGCEFC